MTGIYEIKNRISGKRLVNGSTRVKSSFTKNMSDLWYGVHENCELQDDYNLYLGQNAYEVNLICRCTKAEIIEAEMEYLQEHAADTNLINHRDLNGLPMGEAQQEKARIRHMRQQQIVAGRNAAIAQRQKQQHQG